MIFKVQEIIGQSEWQSKQGSAMLTYKMAGILDGNVESSVEINTVKATPKVPKVGDSIECEIVSRNDYGVKIKRVQASQGQTGTYTPRTDDPEKQASIIRQSSFERSILIQAKKADIFIAEKKFTEAHDAMAFKTITKLSDFIAEYAQGNLSTPPQSSTNLHNVPLKSGSEIISDGVDEFNLEGILDE